MYEIGFFVSYDNAKIVDGDDICTELCFDREMFYLIDRIFQNGFPDVKKVIVAIIESGCDEHRLFEKVLCDCLHRIRQCPDLAMKMRALDNYALALEFIGKEYYNKEENKDAPNKTFC